MLKRDFTIFKMRLLSAGAVLSALLALGSCGGTHWHELNVAPRLTRLLKLDRQLVFAYSRISGDGKLLVYSSERDIGKPLVPTNQRLRVVDLRTSRTLFEDQGIDGYWSPTGEKLVYRSMAESGDQVKVWSRDSGEISNNVIPINLGDYYSWGSSGGVDTLLTIQGWFVSMDASGAKSKPQRMPECEGIRGRGARPLLSRDGERVSIFVSDEIVLRNLRDCLDIVRTGVVGAKADWSRDRKHLSFHTPKKDRPGYDIGILDINEKTFRRISLSGSSLFPSWTDDNALVFRYEGPEFTGFIRADNVLAAETSAAAAPTLLGNPEDIQNKWRGVVPNTGLSVVLVWASWSGHSAEALAAFANAKLDCELAACARLAAYDPSSNLGDVARVFSNVRPALSLVEAPWDAIQASGGLNQSPTYLFFVDGCLIRRALGTMSSSELSLWIRSVGSESLTTTHCMS
jgi:hypothetical protein